MFDRKYVTFHYYICVTLTECCYFDFSQRPHEIDTIKSHINVYCNICYIS